MHPNISQGYLFLRTAKEISDAAAQTYSKMRGGAQSYKLKCQIHGTNQGELSVAPIFIIFRVCGKS
jgi:hypothetical protein